MKPKDCPARGTLIQCCDNPCNHCPYFNNYCEPCHAKTEWAKEFVRQFYIYDLKRQSPAGAEKDAIAFIQSLLDRQREELAEELRTQQDICLKEGALVERAEIAAIIAKKLAAHNQIIATHEIYPKEWHDGAIVALTDLLEALRSKDV